MHALLYTMIQTSQILALLIGTFFSYAAFCLLEIAMRKRRHYVYLILSAALFGGGIWIIQLIMLWPLQHAIHMSYTFPNIVFSFIIATLLSYATLFMMAEENLIFYQLFAASLLGCMSVLAVHFIGISAIHSTTELLSENFGFMLVAALAVGVLGMLLSFTLLSLSWTLKNSLWRYISGIIMAFTLEIVDYISMTLTTLQTTQNTNKKIPLLHSDILSFIIIISLVTMAVLLVVITLSKSRYTYVIKKQESTFRETIRLHQGLITRLSKINDCFVFTFCDGALMHKLGKETDTIVGKTLREVFGESVDFAILESLHERTWQGENIIYEGIHVKQSDLLISLHPLSREGIVREIIASYIDVTARLEYQKALQKVEQVYKIIAENTQDVVFVLNPKGEIEYVSPSCKNFLGYTEEELLLTNGIQLLPTEFHSEMVQALEYTLNAKKSTRYEIELLHANGLMIPCEIVLSPTDIEYSPTHRIIGVVHDLTELKRAEESLVRSEKLLLAGELAASLAHEIRNPLTVMKGFLQIQSSDQKYSPTYMSLILSEMERIEKIVNEFLMLAKPIVVTYTPCDIVNIVNDTMAILEGYALLHKVKIEISAAKDLPLVRGVDYQLKQVLTNILKNAVEAMPDGGIVHVQIGKNERAHIQISIQDEGVGIPESLLNKLGTAFYSTKSKGTGLGLMVSQRIIENHHGKFTIQSMEGNGTTVFIDLPPMRVQEQKTGYTS